MGWLGAYLGLARLLQPAMVVIEDVDLIARDRSDLDSCEESLLNKLLNEMDGLKEDADILFVLTTNRPEQLEEALTGRPGRIDQAIEVPLPDEAGRRKLVQLYGKGLPLDALLVDDAVQRTEGASAAFIKELMRRVAQASIVRAGGASIVSGDISEALDDMLFAFSSIAAPWALRVAQYGTPVGALKRAWLRCSPVGQCVDDCAHSRVVRLCAQ